MKNLALDSESGEWQGPGFPVKNYDVESENDSIRETDFGNFDVKEHHKTGLITLIPKKGVHKHSLIWLHGYAASTYDHNSFLYDIFNDEI